jgi:hypothetical protein
MTNSGYTINSSAHDSNSILMEDKVIERHKSAMIQIWFNEEMDDGEVQDFVDRILRKYHHPDDVVSDYEYWYE